jgi:ABC-type nitrate/sulfonate/bicarbonate transport system substrate-binding protein
MARFVIAPHMRLHEWVAEEKGYFRDEGLDYEFRDQLRAPDGTRQQNLGDRVGAYQTFERGRTCDVSSACHWTVNMAAAAGHGLLYADAYSVAPCGIFVPPESPIRRPEDLAGVPISVGYQSGSHYSTIEALDMFLKPDQIKLSFADGLLFGRLEMLFDRKVPAVNVFSGPYYFLEQMGFRKIVDTSFMMASMVDEKADMADVRKYFKALRRAQADIDLHAHRYTHYYKREFPERFHALMDTRLFGPGERIVFEPYSSSIYHDTQKWILERGIFPEGNPVVRPYESSVARQAAE